MGGDVVHRDQPWLQNRRCRLPDVICDTPLRRHLWNSAPAGCFRALLAILRDPVFQGQLTLGMGRGLHVMGRRSGSHSPTFFFWRCAWATRRLFDFD